MLLNINQTTLYNAIITYFLFFLSYLKELHWKQETVWRWPHNLWMSPEQPRVGMTGVVNAPFLHPVSLWQPTQFEDQEVPGQSDGSHRRTGFLI